MSEAELQALCDDMEQMITRVASALRALKRGRDHWKETADRVDAWREAQQRREHEQEQHSEDEDGAGQVLYPGRFLKCPNCGDLRDGDRPIPTQRWMYGDPEPAIYCPKCGLWPRSEKWDRVERQQHVQEQQIGSSPSWRDRACRERCLCDDEDEARCGSGEAACECRCHYGGEPPVSGFRCAGCGEALNAQREAYRVEGGRAWHVRCHPERREEPSVPASGPLCHFCGKPMGDRKEVRILLDDDSMAHLVCWNGRRPGWRDAVLVSECSLCEGSGSACGGRCPQCNGTGGRKWQEGNLIDRS